MRALYRFLKKIMSLWHTFLARLSCNDLNAKIKANGKTILTPKTTFGKNVHFNGLRVYGQGNVFIGSNFHSGKNCKIITNVHNYNGAKLPYDESDIIKDVFIEDNVWLGMDVTILGGVKIGEGAIIQAGSVVVGNINSLEIAGGHPAKSFSKRDEAHYKALLDKKSFL